MADLNDQTQNVSIYPEGSTAPITSTADGAKERLDVSARIESRARVTTPIHEADGWDSDRTKISYTVPANKILYVQRLWASHESDATGHTISFRVDGTPFYYMDFNNDGTTSFESSYPDCNPYILTEGEVLTAYRESGSSPESWGAGFDGYLEDE